MNKLVYTSIVVFAVLFTVGCVKDDSGASIREFPAFYIDTTGGLGTIAPNAGQNQITVEPKIIYDGDTAKLNYLWRLYVPTGTNVQDPSVASQIDTLGRDRVLRTPLSKPAGTYMLELQATQPNGVRALMRYNVIINSSVPFGWLLAYETVAGGNTDIAHIRTGDIVKNLTTDEVKKTVYSSRNGAPLAGAPISFYNSTTIITNATAVRVVSNDYGKSFDFAQLFTATAPAPKPDGNAGTQFFVNDGVAYWFYNFSTAPFQDAIELTDDKGYRALPRSVSVQGVISSRGFFDDKNKRFVRLLTNESGVATPFAPPATPPAITPRFTLYDVKKNLLSDVVVGISSNTVRYGFFRDLDGSKTWMYGINFTNENNPDAAMFELSAVPGLGTDMNSAKFFELGTVNSMVVCATESKVYSFTYGSTIQDVASGFTAPSGEKITSMRIFKNAGSGFSASETRNNKLLMVATWNETARIGRLYILSIDPMTGQLLSPMPLNVIEGFGKINDMILKAS